MSREDCASVAVLARDELDEAESAPPGLQLEATRRRQPPIDDVAAATSWWSQERDDSDDELDGEDEVEDDEAVEPQEPYRAQPKVGRNASCPSGSGKKYKKCCGR
ncbi:MAG TPA: SEC-C metal-binding domain-containing protein [Vicinamibacterales bacterium]|nr:SEC-C metal-binding domain-containing protein [Vicinamibacterales bacterium]